MTDRPFAPLVLVLLLVLASVCAGAPPAAAAEKTFDFAIGVDHCEYLDGSPQVCEQRPTVALPTEGVLKVQFVASAAAGVCPAGDVGDADILVHIVVDGAEPLSYGPFAPGQGTGVLDVGPIAAGVHAVEVKAARAQAVGEPDDCILLNWAGTLSLTVSGVTSADAAIIAPGESGSVSTLAGGAAGLEAFYTLPAGASGLATFSAATYESVFIPVPPPIAPLAGGVAFVDLLLLGASPTAPCLVDFVPPNPVVPPNPTAPIPPPIVPPNPVRLAYWDGAAWAPVLDGAGAPPPYVSATNRFSIALTATSAPQVTGLTGTVFAFVAGYGFAGFTAPVDSGALNVAKAGRAIPLKWRLYDLGNNPVVDLTPASVAVTSVAMDCGALSGGADAVEAYAAGASGLQNLGDGYYQFNWATLKSYAGTCRRLRLDLGERNPDGTPFYRTADFSFTR